MNYVNIGIIGSGFIVPVFINASKAFEDFHLRAIWGRHEEKLIPFEKEVDYYTTDLERILSDETIDVIYVALPNKLHYEYALKALKHGKHVILEKPFTVRYKEAKKLIDLAREKGLIIFEAIPSGYSLPYQEARKHLKELGEIRMVVCNYSQYSRRYDRFKKGEILPAFDKKLAGGALMDLGVYNIRFVISAFGMPKKVEYHANIEKGVDTSGILVLDYGKFKATCIAAKDCKSDSYAIIQGDKGYLRCNTTTSRAADFTLKLNDGTERQFSQSEKGEFASWSWQLKEFDQIYRKKDLNKAYEWNRLTLIESKVLDKALESADLSY